MIISKDQMPKSRWRDLTGQRFGRLVAIGPTGKRTKHLSHIWLCLCDCGNTKEVPASCLTNKKSNVKSCGCLLKDMPSRIQHGMTGTPIHTRWMVMMRRCHAPTAHNYARYGGNGILVDPEWHDFRNFYRDMGDMPGDDYEIHRIDNTKGYGPGNCEWLTKADHRERHHPTTL